MTDAPRTRRFVVDRREGRYAVLVADDDRDFDVPASELPKECRAEGAVLDVPIGSDGAPRWSEAQRNRGEEERRFSDARKILEQLKQRDPGGDIEL